MNSEAFNELSCVPIQIKCGGSHCALVTSDGALYTWGSGAYGATGFGSDMNTYEPKTPVYNGFDLDELEIKYVSCAMHGTAVVTQ